jgi:hypothetical protein
MSEGVFKREKVLFHIVGQGSLEVEYEVGAETPEEAFYGAYDPNKFGSLIKLARDTPDFDFVVTASTEPATEFAIEKNIIDGHLDPENPYKVVVGKTPYFFSVLDDAQMFLARELGIIEEMEQADNARAREDEADQWRMNR